MTDISVYAKPWQKLIDEVEGPILLHGPKLEDLLAGWEAVGARLVAHLTFPSPDESIKTKDIKISQNVTVRIYTPLNYAGGKVAGLFLHGGGWAMGSLDEEDEMCRYVAKDVGIILVSVGYRLAPKDRYPAALDDCVEAFHWTLKHAAELDIDSKQLFTFGSSAGGGLAIGTALRLIDEGHESAVKGVVANVPVTIHPDAVPEKLKSQYTSYKEHAENTVNTASAMTGFFDAYAAPKDCKYTSCLLHPRLKDLRKVYLNCAGTDTLRDDARLFKMALDDAGVPNKFDEYPGYPHFFWAVPSKHTKEINAEFKANLSAGINFVLT